MKKNIKTVSDTILGWDHNKYCSILMKIELINNKKETKKL